MSRQNVEVVHGMFEATNRRDWESVMAGYADDVQLVVAGSFLFTGKYSGKAAVGGWFADWLRTFERDYRFEVEETFEISNAVVVLMRHRGRGKRSGAEVEARTAYAFWVREGRIVRVELHDELAQALEAVGLPG